MKPWANNKHQELENQVGPRDLEQLDQDLIPKVFQNAMLKEEDQQEGQELETENPSARAGGADVKMFYRKFYYYCFDFRLFNTETS